MKPILFLQLLNKSWQHLPTLNKRRFGLQQQLQQPDPGISANIKSTEDFKEEKMFCGHMHKFSTPSSEGNSATVFSDKVNHYLCTTIYGSIIYSFFDRSDAHQST